MYSISVHVLPVVVVPGAPLLVVPGVPGVVPGAPGVVPGAPGVVPGAPAVVPGAPAVVLDEPLERGVVPDERTKESIVVNCEHAPPQDRKSHLVLCLQSCDL